MATFCTVYDYNNHSMNHPAQLWEHNGLISYVSFGPATAWHGEFNRDVLGMLHLRFDCEGRDDRLKTARLLLVGTNPATYEGYDCMGRFITMTRIGRYSLTEDPANPTRRIWRALQE